MDQRGPWTCARVTSAVAVLERCCAHTGWKSSTGCRDDVPDGQRWHLQPDGGRFDQRWELCSCILESPAAVRTSGDIMGWDSSKGGNQKRPRKSLLCSFCRKVRENIEETPKSVLQKLSHAHQLPGQAETGWKSTGAGKMHHAARNLAGRFIFCTHILC